MDQTFYERLHSENRVYGLSSYNLDRLIRSRAFRSWGKNFAGEDIRVLDIGCGKGQFMLELGATLRGRAINVRRIVGLDLVRAEPNVFKEIVPNLEFVQQSVDGQKLPFSDETFEFVSCNHVLEHVFETEKLLREIRRVLADDGLAVVSVPNIAAWMNRIAFLFGGQPLGSEVGTESVTYGFWPTYLKRKLKSFFSIWTHS